MSLYRPRAAGPTTLRVGGETPTLTLEPATDALSARGEDGRAVTYWMVWKALYPDTQRGESPP